MMKLHNWWVIILIVLGFALGNVWSINITQSVKINLLDLGVIFGLIIYFPKMFKKHWGLDYLRWFLLAGVIALILSLRLFSWVQILIGSLYLLRFWAYSAFFALNVWEFKLHQNTSLIYVLGSVIVISGLFQYIFFPDIRPLAALQWDMHYYRVVGSFLDPGFTALLLSIFFLYQIITPVKQKGLYWVGLVSTYMALALTYSRSGYLALLAGAAFLAYKRKSLKLFLIILAILSITVVGLPRSPDGEGVKLERANSIWARVDSWQTALKIWSQQPVFGVGFNNYRYAQNKYGFLTDSKWEVSHAGAGADSSLLFVAATTGIVGLIAYLALIKKIFSLGDLALQTSLVAALVHSLFLNSLFYPAVIAWFGLLIVQATELRSR